MIIAPLGAGVNTLYEKDVIAWSKRQAELLRSGNFAELDVKNVADEIESVGKSELRELTSRMAVLLSDLLIGQFQPSQRRNSRQAAIQTQRRIIQRKIEKTPSLKVSLQDAGWWADAFDDALALAVKETDIPLAAFPQDFPWFADDIFNENFFPTTSSGGRC